MPAEIFADGDQDYIEKFNTVAQQAFDGDAAAGRLDDHIDGTADKHGASAIVNTPAGGIAATDVQAAINELDTEKQPIDATLTALAGVTTAADKLIYATGADTFATTDLTSAGRALMDDADASAQRTTLGLGTAATLASDTDTTLAANSDTRLATQKAVKAYVDALLAASDAVAFSGVTDCSANPNYPAADAGHLYIVSVAGKIGGASGVTVEAGDMFICKVDSTASGNQATVGANWGVIQTNINGAVTGPASAVDGRVALFDGATGKQIKDSGLTLSGTNTGDQTSVTGNAGTATALQNARTIDGQSFNGTANITVVAPGTVAAAAKTTPVDADVFPLADSAASNVLKKVTWANIKTTLNYRERLTADRAYYVRTDGSDSNNGLSNWSGGAFLTLQNAIDTCAKIDNNGYVNYIFVADGTYTAGALASRPFMGEVFIVGNQTNPENVIISVTNGSCLTASNGATIKIGWVELRTTTSGQCLLAVYGGNISFQSVRFGAAADTHISAGYAGVVASNGNYSIVGSAVNSHLHCFNNGLILTNSITVTLTGTPSFGAYFCGVAYGGQVQAIGVTYSGSATGPRYLAHRVAGIETGGGGASYFPGDSAGTANATTFGVYT